MEMQTNSGARLIAVGSEYFVNAVLSAAKQSPMVDIKTNEMYPPSAPEFAATGEGVDVAGEIVCYKHGGRVIVILGAPQARQKIAEGLGVFKARLVSKQALKRCKVPDANAEMMEVKSTRTYDAREQDYPNSFKNTPRIIDKRPATAALESKANAEAVTGEPLGQSVDFVAETVSASPGARHAGSDTRRGEHVHRQDSRGRNSSADAGQHAPRELRAAESASAPARSSEYRGSGDSYDRHQRNLREMGKPRREQQPLSGEAVRPGGTLRGNIDLTAEEAAMDYPTYPKWAELSDFEKRNVRMGKKQHAVDNAEGKYTFAPTSWRDEHFARFGVFPGKQPGANTERHDGNRKPRENFNRAETSSTGYAQTDRVIRESRAGGAAQFGRRRERAPQ